ncbi:phage tail protein [Leifsonia sp. NPDC058230]|uniref:phage tail protein n=1 Tax=Leifsonia sp. NPDC058230 TaxID=3346391 RepID=UPI0036D9A28B
MANPYLAEIRLVPFTFAPPGWALCNGQLLGISQNTALFSLLGTTYGGDGRSTFALPDLQGRTAMHPAAGLHELGDSGGAETVALIASEMPVHTHTVSAVDALGTTNSPASASFATPRIGRTPEPTYAAASGPLPLSPSAFNPAGGSLPHNNMPPYLTLNYMIAVQGVFPLRPQ